MGLPDRIFIYQGPIEDVCNSRAEVVEEVRKTVMHEVGHTLGLRHNFRSSTVYNLRQIQDAEFQRADVQIRGVWRAPRERAH